MKTILLSCNNCNAPMNPGGHTQILICEYCGSSMKLIPLSRHSTENRIPQLQKEVNELDEERENNHELFMAKKKNSHFHKARFSKPKMPTIIGLSVMLASIVCANHTSEMLVLIGGIVLSMALLAKEVDYDVKCIEAKSVSIDMRGNLPNKRERRKAA